ncbi:hypothetical protein ACFLX2_01465 [Candidatus Dependentiae bacterium]
MSFKKSLRRIFCFLVLFLLTTTRTVLGSEGYDLSFHKIKAFSKINGSWHGGPLTKEFLKEMADLFKTKLFIETGTQYGYTLDRAREYFQDVYSTEIERSLYQKAVRKFQHNENVHLFFGDSPDGLIAILPDIHESALFWLDAHYSDVPVPIFREIEAISDHYKGQPILLVDDIRNFRRCSNFPSVNELRNFVLKHYQDYEFVLLFDAALAYPRSLAITISPVLKACTVSYLSEDRAFVVQEDELLEAEEIIMSCAGQEKELISRLHTIYPENPTYHFWAGLVCLKEQPRQAINHFKQAERRGFKHARLQRYKDAALNTIT